MITLPILTYELNLSDPYVLTPALACLTIPVDIDIWIFKAIGIWSGAPLTSNGELRLVMDKYINGFITDVITLTCLASTVIWKAVVGVNEFFLPWAPLTNFNPSVGYIISIIKCELKWLIHSQTSSVQPYKFWNGLIISSHTLLGNWLFIRVGIQFKPC